MPQPTGGDVHVDAAMTQISLAYKNPNYIYGRVFPPVNLKQRSDYYYEFTAADWFRDEADVKPPGADAKRSGFNLSTTSIYVRKWALSTLLAWDDRDNADDVLNLERSKTEWVTDKVMMRLERVLAATAFASGSWTTTPTVGTDFTAWSTYASSNPIQDVDGWKDDVHKLTGFEPNKLLIGKQVWTKLKSHPEILGRMKNTSNQIPTPAIVAEIMELEEIIIGKPIYETAAEGGTSSTAFIWGKNALLYYVPKAAGKEVPSAGYNFTWKNRKVRSWDETGPEATVYECQWATEPVVTGADLGVYAASVVA